MFQKLRQRWGVSAGRLVLILCTFAIGGSLCGYAARKLLQALDLPDGFIWWLVYLVAVTLLWPVAVMLVSILFGQFSFFKTYLMRMARRMGFAKPPRDVKKGRKTADASDAV